MHGHNYIVVVELSARAEDLTSAGFVRDYRDLDAFKKWVDDVLDHRNLNDVLPKAMPPTSEVLAMWIFDEWAERYPELTAVKISETPRTWATYRPS